MDGPLIAIAIINKTPLPNGNCPITDPIAEMGVAHTVGQRIWNVTLWWLQLHCVVQIDSSHATIMFYQKILSSFTCLNIQIKSQFNRDDQILQDYSWYVLFNRTRLFCLSAYKNVHVLCSVEYYGNLIIKFYKLELSCINIFFATQAH